MAAGRAWCVQGRSRLCLPACHVEESRRDFTDGPRAYKVVSFPLGVEGMLPYTLLGAYRCNMCEHFEALRGREKQKI